MTELPKGKCGLAVWPLPTLQGWEWHFTSSLRCLAWGPLFALIGSRVTHRPQSPPPGDELSPWMLTEVPAAAGHGSGRGQCPGASAVPPG